MPTVDLRGRQHVFYGPTARSELVMNRGNTAKYGDVHLARGDTIRYVVAGADKWDIDVKVYMEAGGKVLKGAVGQRAKNSGPLAEDQYGYLDATGNRTWFIDDDFPNKFTIRFGIYGYADPSFDEVSATIILDRPEPYELWFGEHRIWHKPNIYVGADPAHAKERWLSAGDTILFRPDAGAPAGVVYLEANGAQRAGTPEIATSATGEWHLNWASGWRPGRMDFTVRLAAGAKNPATDPTLLTVHFNGPKDATDTPSSNAGQWAVPYRAVLPTTP